MRFKISTRVAVYGIVICMAIILMNDIMERQKREAMEDAISQQVEDSVNATSEETAPPEEEAAPKDEPPPY